MGDRVAVYNAMSHDYAEMFNGKNIEIPAHGYVVMDRFEAGAFMGQMSAPLAGGGWTEKRLQMKEIDESKLPAGTTSTPEKKTTWVCNFDGLTFDDKFEYQDHLATHKDVPKAELAKASK